jgi:CheY-like chemotaxis protein/HPt (histidine-containing phosphotransfer) domain-containing protein
VGKPFDAVILDMHMPGMSGVEVALEVAADASIAGTPMAVLTSSNQQGEAAGARAAGAEVYLTKPVREGQLYEGVSRLLGNTGPGHVGEVGATARPRHTGRLLVAEDNAVNQQVVVAMLDALGFDADIAADGRHAVELFTTGDYAAVLMDCQMPRLDGYAATRELRLMGSRGAEVPVIALTASALASDEQRCREAGMNDFVTKPLRPATLERVLDRWLGGTRPAASRAGDPLDGDVLAGLGALGPEVLLGVASTFLDTVPDQMAALRAAAGTGEVADVRRLAHTIRGSAGYVGATALADAYAELETAELSRVTAMLDTVDAELARVCEALRTLLSA